jgi:Protein of unknown function (DUF2938)
MIPGLRYLVGATLIGLGATLFIDLWAFGLRRAFNILSLNYCLLGRWLLHMPGGTLVHRSISAAPPRDHECPVGWCAHYSIGAGLAIAFLPLASASWLEHPTLLPALAFGWVTTLIPLFILQPSLGLGVASSKTPKPTRARVKSLMTHTVYGLGLYAWALLLRPVLFAG